MRLFGFRLKSLIFHPLLCLEAYKVQSYPVVNLDNPEKNCVGCGHDHSLGHKNRVKCLCCKYGHCASHKCCFCQYA